jgi:VWFA-related protein
VSLAAAIGGVAASGQAPQPSITLSAVVLDQNDAPVTGLRATDFEVTENGRPVNLIDIDAVDPAALELRPRSLVLVLGASGTPPSQTLMAQSIARGFFSGRSANDDVAVVRMAYRDRDLIAGDRAEMLKRVDDFRAGAGEPTHDARDVLKLVAILSDDLRGAAAPRRAIVFIGSPFVFDVRNPPQQEYELEWSYWVDALTAAARANVSVYVIDANGLTGSIPINPDGLVAQTGGTVFFGSNDITRARDRIWRDTSSYYVLRYRPLTTGRELQSVTVKVTRAGATVFARRSR